MAFCPLSLSPSSCSLPPELLGTDCANAAEHWRFLVVLVPGVCGVLATVDLDLFQGRTLDAGGTIAKHSLTELDIVLQDDAKQKHSLQHPLSISESISLSLSHSANLPFSAVFQIVYT